MIETPTIETPKRLIKRDGIINTLTGTRVMVNLYKTRDAWYFEDPVNDEPMRATVMAFRQVHEQRGVIVRGLIIGPYFLSLISKHDSGKDTERFLA